MYAIYVFSWSCVLVWAFAFVSPTPRGDVDVCNAKGVYGGNLHIFFPIYGVLSMVLLISTILLYIVTLNLVRKRYMKTFAWKMKNGQPEAGHSKSQNPSKENNMYRTEIGKRKIFGSLKVVGIIVTLLLLLTGPFVILIFMTVFNLGSSNNYGFVASALSALNSALNPFVYSLRIESFRKELKAFFRMCLKTEQ
jgi:hypothetical protein